MTSRPHTAGSLKRAKSVRSSKRKVEIKEEPDEKSMVSNRSLASEIRRPKSVKSIQRKKLKNDEDVLVREVKEEVEKVEEKEEIDGES